MTTITARYIDTCLSSYLQDGCNRPGQSLCLTGLGGSLPDTIEGLMDSMDFDAGIPETVSNGEIAKALRGALEGVDLRYIDEHGVRQSNPGDDERDGEEPYIYVVIEWDAE